MHEDKNAPSYTLRLEREGDSWVARINGIPDVAGRGRTIGEARQNLMYAVQESILVQRLLNFESKTEN